MRYSNNGASRSVWAVIPCGPAPALRQALKEDLIAWPISALGVFAITAAGYGRDLLICPIGSH